MVTYDKSEIKSIIKLEKLHLANIFFKSETVYD
jgi:hypothetical protein